MNLFIFGAGASFDSQKIPLGNGQKSPLLNDLFSECYKVHSHGILSNEEFVECQILTKKYNSLEKWLTERWEKRNSWNQTKREYENSFLASITFFVWKVMLEVSKKYDESNIYSLFLKKIKEQDLDAAYITFNYDTLLDKALISHAGASLERLDDYLERRLIKLHGSVNWFLPQRDGDPNIAHTSFDAFVHYRTAFGRMYNGTSFSLGSMMCLPPGHRSLNSLEDIFGVFGNQYFFPLVFMPVVSKLYNLVNEYETKIIEAAVELFRNTYQVYLIGYRATDALIGDLFRRTGPILYVNVVSENISEAEKIYERIHAYNPIAVRKGRMFGTGFRNFVENEFSSISFNG